MILFILAFLMVCGLLSYISVADPWKGISSPSAQATGEGRGEARRSRLAVPREQLQERDWARKPGRKGRRVFGTPVARTGA